MGKTFIESASRRWGEFVKRRSFAVGFRSQVGLAGAVGCSEHQIGKWINSDWPPDRMRRGLDIKLCRALSVSRETLFTLWAQVYPEGLPVLSEEDDEKCRQEIVATVRTLTGEKLKALNSIAKSLVSNAA